MAVTILTGLQDDSTILSNRRVIDMNPVISMLDPDQSQFSTILMKLASKPAFSQKVEWLEDQLMPRVTTLAVTAATTGTIVVASNTGAYFKPGDICRIVQTGEAFSVSSISTDTITVSARALGSVAAASATTGTDVMILGNASNEGGTLPTRKMTKKVAAYNLHWEFWISLN